MNKLRTFFSLSVRKKVLFIETFLSLIGGRFLKGLPFSMVAPSLGAYMEETSLCSMEEHRKQLKEISDCIEMMSHYTFFESKCLVKAFAASKMLERRKIESTLYLGMAKDTAGKLAAHAWLRSGPFFITGAQEMESFTVVGTFAKRNSL